MTEDQLWILIGSWGGITLFVMLLGMLFIADATDEPDRKFGAEVVVFSPLAPMIIVIILIGFPFYIIWTAVKILWPSVTKS